MTLASHRPSGAAFEAPEVGGAVPSVAELPRIPTSMSASYTIDRRQQLVLVAIAAVVLAGIAVNPLVACTALVTGATCLYLSALVFRLYIFSKALSAPGLVTVSDEDARALPDEQLPIYTVMVAAYREPEVIGRLLASLGRIDYPPERLDVQVLLEADDEDTIAAALAAHPARHIQIVRVPFSEPRTKPKALNYGLARARGSFVTIYDAEDRPEPLQLRRAVAAFRDLPAEVACLQAKLSYFNADQNLITRWFTGEYAMWFSHLLPGLVASGAPVPLGGTSNHFRREVLQGVGAWDPHNVTEDADLGIRLARAGYRTEVLDSTTLEEANSDFINWAKQRSRWYKGYMQTWLVHMRHPADLRRQLGTPGFLAFSLFVGGTPLLALLNPLFWMLMSLWFLARVAFVAALFPNWGYHLALTCLVVGNFTFLYSSVLSARATGSPSLVWAALLSPLYWGMMSLAAIKAFIQLFHAPSFWEKTVHGLDEQSTLGASGHHA